MSEEQANPYHDPTARYYVATGSRRQYGVRRDLVIEKATGEPVARFHELNEAQEDCARRNAERATPCT